jgi:DNA polymerase III epsilon subunit-like protein
VSKKVLVMDTETAGLDPAVSSILSFAAVIYEDGSVCGTFKTLVQEPTLVIEEMTERQKARGLKSAFDVNGITREEIAAAPEPWLAIQLFKNWLMKNELYGLQQIVAHNAAFDAGFLKRCWRLGGQDWEDTFHHRVLCTQTAALLLEMAGRINLPGGCASLNAVADALGCKPRESAVHDALEDALLCADVMRKMMEKLK